MITILIFLLFALFFASILDINRYRYIYPEGIILTIMGTLVFGFIFNLGVSYMFSFDEEIIKNYTLLPIADETVLSQDSEGWTFRIREQVDSNLKKPVFKEFNLFTNEWYHADIDEPFIQKIIIYRKFKKGIWFFGCPTKYIINEKYILYLPMDYEVN
jgi:hypothetical protein